MNASIPAADSSYDAVFDFGIIHHIPHWRSALAEVRRVLKPGGRFYAEEVLAAFIRSPVVRRLLEHPQSDRFDRQTFGSALGEAGLELQGSMELARAFAWFVADKPAAT